MSPASQELLALQMYNAIFLIFKTDRHDITEILLKVAALNTLTLAKTVHGNNKINNNKIKNWSIRLNISKHEMNVKIYLGSVCSHNVLVYWLVFNANFMSISATPWL